MMKVLAYWFSMFQTVPVRVCAIVYASMCCISYTSTETIGNLVQMKVSEFKYVIFL